MAAFKRIDHIALHVSDLPASIVFYETHFGFINYFEQVTQKGTKIAYLRLADTVLELVDREDLEMGGFHWCLETDDFDEAILQLKHSGLEILQPPQPTEAREPKESGWRRVVFKGPDGEQIEIRG
jgi:lactoylglutathione lyase